MVRSKALKSLFAAIPLSVFRKLNDPRLRFHYRSRKEVADLLLEKQKQAVTNKLLV